MFLSCVVSVAVQGYYNSGAQTVTIQTKAIEQYAYFVHFSAFSKLILDNKLMFRNSILYFRVECN